MFANKDRWDPQHLLIIASRDSRNYVWNDFVPQFCYRVTAACSHVVSLFTSVHKHTHTHITWTSCVAESAQNCWGTWARAVRGSFTVTLLRLLRENSMICYIVSWDVFDQFYSVSEIFACRNKLWGNLSSVFNIFYFWQFCISSDVNVID